MYGFSCLRASFAREKVKGMMRHDAVGWICRSGWSFLNSQIVQQRTLGTEHLLRSHHVCPLAQWEWICWCQFGYTLSCPDEFFLGTVHRPAHATVQASLQPYIKAFGPSTCLNSLACSKTLRYVVLCTCNRSSCLSLLPLQLPQMHGSWGVVVSRTSTFEDSKTSTPLHSKHRFLMPRCCGSKDEPLLMLDEELVQAEKGINLILYRIA